MLEIITISEQNGKKLTKFTTVEDQITHIATTAVLHEHSLMVCVGICGHLYTNVLDVI
jgi:hypothetical protein